MPQDGLKSAVYRSFITCDDPKGVVDCGVIRRTKSSSDSQKMEKQKKNESRRKSKNTVSTPSMEIISQGQQFQSSSSSSSSSFQLMEVSRGAQKLNHMIDSWSKEKKKFDHGQDTKDIAKDLLKGALDLQESLAMLGKLQEASQFMSSLSRKHMKNPERAYSNRGEDQAFVQPRLSNSDVYSSRISTEEFRKGRKPETAYSNRYEDQAFVQPRLSSDGYSSRTNTEELKKVIRDSLVSQKLFENSSTAAEKGYAYCTPRYRDSISESTPSTSSSQSSMYHTYSDYSSIASASASAAEKAKSPSLIAKLMGIEEYPSKPVQEVEKISNQKRPAFDIDRHPKVRKPQTAPQNVDQEKRTLKEVLETMRFKGLLRNNYFEEPKPDFHYSNFSELGRRFSCDSPPVVLIKPIAAESPDMESHVPMVRDKEAFYSRKMLNNRRIPEEVSPKTMRSTEEALMSEKMQRTLEVEQTPIKKLSKDDGAKEHRVAVQKHGDKESKTKEMASRKLKASHPAVQKPQKKEATEKRVDKIQKVAAVSRKSPEKHIAKAKNVSKSQGEDHVTSAKARTPESGSNITKTRISQQPITVTNTASKQSMTQSVVSNSTERRRNPLRKEKPVKEPKEDKSVTKNVVIEENVRRIDALNDGKSSPIKSNIDPPDQLLKEEEKKTYGSQSEGHCNIFQGLLFEATTLSSKQGTSTETAKEVSVTQSKYDGNTFKGEETLRILLLRNASFLNHAEEYFDVSVNSSTIFQTSTMSDSEVYSTRLVLDCANELVECRSFQVSQTAYPLSLKFGGMSRVLISLDKLVEDVCKGIENLRDNSKLSGENLLADSLYAMLERDVMCKGVGKGTWDLNWRNGFSGDEAEQVVKDIERQIFTGLVEEIFA